MSGDTPARTPRPRWFDQWDEPARQEYAHRFTDLAARGEDVDGEARFVDAMARRGSTILDAGCGVGRVAAALAAQGHRAHGVDVDPILIDHGRTLNPDLPLAVLDLVEATPDSLAAARLPAAYDLVVCAGNVMHFTADGTEARVVANLAALLVPGGRLVFGFGTDRAFTPDLLDQHAEAAGLTREHRFADWELRPFHDGAGWAVSVYTRP